MLIVAIFKIDDLYFTWVPITGWRDKENMVYVHNEILLDYEEKWKAVIVATWKELEAILPVKISQIQKYKDHTFFITTSCYMSLFSWYT
jgi:hypothetical protein